MSENLINKLSIPSNHQHVVDKTIASYPWQTLQIRHLHTGVERFPDGLKVKTAWGFFFIKGYEEDLAAVGTLTVNEDGSWHWELSRHDNGGAGLSLQMQVFGKVYEGKDFFFVLGYGGIDGTTP